MNYIYLDSGTVGHGKDGLWKSTAILKARRTATTATATRVRILCTASMEKTVIATHTRRLCQPLRRRTMMVTVRVGPLLEYPWHRCQQPLQITASKHYRNRSSTSELARSYSRSRSTSPYHRKAQRQTRWNVGPTLMMYNGHTGRRAGHATPAPAVAG